MNLGEAWIQEYRDEYLMQETLSYPEVGEMSYRNLKMFVMMRHPSHQDMHLEDTLQAYPRPATPNSGTLCMVPASDGRSHPRFNFQSTSWADTTRSATRASAVTETLGHPEIFTSHNIYLPPGSRTVTVWTYVKIARPQIFICILMKLSIRDQQHVIATM